MRVLAIDVGTKNLGVCAVQHEKILAWDVLTLRGGQAAQVHQSLQESHALFEAVDRCVIEKQPPRNPTMCRIQHYLEFWCATKNIPVTIQDARAKLRYAESTQFWAHDDDTSTYHRRKKAAVAVVGRLLDATDQPPEAKRVFRASKKKDDLADSLLHALHYTNTTTLQKHKRPGKGSEIVRACKPGKKQRETQDYSASNVKWLLKNEPDAPGLDAARQKFSFLFVD